LIHRGDSSRPAVYNPAVAADDRELEGKPVPEFVPGSLPGRYMLQNDPLAPRQSATTSLDAPPSATQQTDETPQSDAPASPFSRHEEQEAPTVQQHAIAAPSVPYGDNPPPGLASPAPVTAWEPIPAFPPNTISDPSRAIAQAPGSVYVNGQWFVPAGFSLRLRAFLVDWVILSILGWGLLALVQIPQPDPARELKLSMRALSELGSGRMPSRKVTEELDRLRRPALLAGWLNVALCAAYFIAFHTLAGTTPGKAACGLRLLRRDGSRAGINWCALRYLIYLAGARFLYGVFTMPFDPQRRALHDLAAGTNVFRELRWR
jgi:uncharacterized RDD family membrane protein YckC